MAKAVAQRLCVKIAAGNSRTSRGTSASHNAEVWNMLERGAKRQNEKAVDMVYAAKATHTIIIAKDYVQTSTATKGGGGQVRRNHTCFNS